MTVKKKTQRKKAQQQGRRREPQKRKQELFVRECILWLVLALCLILFLSTFGICGVAGDLCASLFFGLFGLMGYIFPALLFALVRLGLGNQALPDKLRLNGSLTVLFLCLCGMIQMLFAGNAADTAAELYAAAIRDHLSGGVAGGMLAKGLAYIVGESGAYILMTVGVIISLVLLTRKSFMQPIRSGGEKAVRTVQKRQQEILQERRDRNAVRKNQRQYRQMRKGSAKGGVNFDLTDLKHNEENPSPQPVEAVSRGRRKAKISAFEDIRREVNEPEPMELEPVQEMMSEAKKNPGRP